MKCRGHSLLLIFFGIVLGFKGFGLLAIFPPVKNLGFQELEGLISFVCEVIKWQYLVIQVVKRMNIVKCCSFWDFLGLGMDIKGFWIL